MSASAQENKTKEALQQFAFTLAKRRTMRPELNPSGRPYAPPKSFLSEPAMIGGQLGSLAAPRYELVIVCCSNIFSKRQTRKGKRSICQSSPAFARTASSSHNTMRILPVPIPAHHARLPRNGHGPAQTNFAKTSAFNNAGKHLEHAPKAS